jgi:hypothetical protein
MDNNIPSLDEQMAKAIEKQIKHIQQSMKTDRTGWTLQQWTDDAHKQFNDLDGTVGSLVNGHVTALLREIDLLKYALRLMRNTVGYVTIDGAVHTAENESLTPYKPVAYYFGGIGNDADAQDT